MQPGRCSPGPPAHWVTSCEVSTSGSFGFLSSKVRFRVVSMRLLRQLREKDTRHSVVTGAYQFPPTDSILGTVIYSFAPSMGHSARKGGGAHQCFRASGVGAGPEFCCGQRAVRERERDTGWGEAPLDDTV